MPPRPGSGPADSLDLWWCEERNLSEAIGSWSAASAGVHRQIKGSLRISPKHPSEVCITEIIARGMLAIIGGRTISRHCSYQQKKWLKTSKISKKKHMWSLTMLQHTDVSHRTSGRGFNRRFSSRFWRFPIIQTAACGSVQHHTMRSSDAALCPTPPVLIHKPCTAALEQPL